MNRVTVTWDFGRRSKTWGDTESVGDQHETVALRGSFGGPLKAKREAVRLLRAMRQQDARMLTAAADAFRDAEAA